MESRDAGRASLGLEAIGRDMRDTSERALHREYYRQLK
jgi:hypothetical protein